MTTRPYTLLRDGTVQAVVTLGTISEDDGRYYHDAAPQEAQKRGKGFRTRVEAADHLHAYRTSDHDRAADTDSVDSAV